MKGHRGVKLQLHSFWNSELCVGWWSASLYSRYHSTEGWMVPEPVWVFWSSQKPLGPARNQTEPRFHSCPVRSLVTTVSTVTFILLRCPLHKGKGNPVTGPGGPIGWVEVYLNSFLTSALEGGVWSASRPGRLYPRERPGTHCTGSWVVPCICKDNYIA